MAYRDLEPVSKQLTIVVGLTVVGFMTFGLALSFYRNILFQETLLGINDENGRLRQANADSQADLDYFRSVQYKDKFAKESLGKVNRGERVLIISPGGVSAGVPTEQEQQEIDEHRAVAFEEMLRQMPVIEHWSLFLLERKKLEELRKSYLEE
ncbi:MAG: hypothetical protein PHW10_06265 [Candidatus Peribacteraceae bacterium]|nr:hypothetical protein [Candidatus Peribacteraceae bacterium]